MELTDEQRARLPKGVQAYIGQLERTIESLTERNAELTEGPADSDTIVNPSAALMTKGAVPMPFKRGTEVEFVLDEGWGGKIGCRTRTLENGKRVLELRGDRRLAQRSVSSNVIHFFNLPLEDA